MKEMEYKVILLLTLIIKVQGVLVSDNMTRNPLYDTRAPLGTNIILTLNLSSSLTCASHCTTNPTCKSLLYNTITQYCQLLSVQMNPGLDNGPQTSMGWRYYERKLGKINFFGPTFFFDIKVLAINELFNSHPSLHRLLHVTPPSHN